MPVLQAENDLDALSPPYQNMNTEVTRTIQNKRLAAFIAGCRLGVPRINLGSVQLAPNSNSNLLWVKIVLSDKVYIHNKLDFS